MPERAFLDLPDAEFAFDLANLIHPKDVIMITALADAFKASSWPVSLAYLAISLIAANYDPEAEQTEANQADEQNDPAPERQFLQGASAAFWQACYTVARVRDEVYEEASKVAAVFTSTI